MSSPFDVVTTIIPAVLLERVIGRLPEDAHPIDVIAAVAKEGGYSGAMSGVLGALLFGVVRVVVWIGRKLPRPLGWILEAVLLYLVLSPNKLAQTALAAPLFQQCTEGIRHRATPFRSSRPVYYRQCKKHLPGR